MRKPRARGTWFKRHFDEFSPIVKKFAGLPITYVEVGTWTGNSAYWVANHILTHPDASGHGIDPYESDHKHPQKEVNEIKKIAAERLASTKVKWKWWYEDSKEALRKFDEPIDLLYLDGSHCGWDVVLDFAMAWRRLKPGSVVIFDDMNPSKGKHLKIARVRQGFEAIKLAWGAKIVVLNNGPKQGALRVVSK